MAVKVTLDRNRVLARVQNGETDAAESAARALMEYGNIFVREDTGLLRDSAHVKQSGTEAEVIWDPAGGYAKKVYYTGTPAKDKNPNASLMWAEKAAKSYEKEIQQVYQNAFTKGMKK